MTPGIIVNLLGKVTVQTSFGWVAYGLRRGAKRGTPVARVLVLPDLDGSALSAWLKDVAKDVYPCQKGKRS